jgi:hypothetical protein
MIPAYHTQNLIYSNLISIDHLFLIYFSAYFFTISKLLESNSFNKESTAIKMFLFRAKFYMFGA